MRLEQRRYMVKDVHFSAPSRLEGEVLHLDREELLSTALDGLSGFALQLNIARPGESCRIVHVMDALIPSFKQDGPAFSGWPDRNPGCGQGVTVQTEGLTVMQTGVFPGIQEGIVDMSGSGSKYSRFSKTINVVVSLKLLDSGIAKPDFEQAAKTILLRAGAYIARVCSTAPGGESAVFELANSAAELPKLGYACFIQAQGSLRNVFLHGENCVHMTPQWIHPNEMLDGGVVSSNFIIACQKNPTYFYQRNPVVLELYRRHGAELDFGGVILSTESSLLEEKMSNAAAIARIARDRGLDGLVVSQEGGGHADVDLMMTAEACEPLGIRTVLLANEIAGPDGDLPPLVSFSRQADAIVTAGNNDALIAVDAVDRVVGGDSILGGKFGGCDSFETSLGILYTSTNQMGANRMTAMEY